MQSRNDMPIIIIIGILVLGIFIAVLFAGCEEVSQAKPRTEVLVSPASPAPETPETPASPINDNLGLAETEKA